jgi:hypothetical protein
MKCQRAATENRLPGSSTESLIEGVVMPSQMGTEILVSTAVSVDYNANEKIQQ